MKNTKRYRRTVLLTHIDKKENKDIRNKAKLLLKSIIEQIECIYIVDPQKGDIAFFI